MLWMKAENNDQLVWLIITAILVISLTTQGALISRSLTAAISRLYLQFWVNRCQREDKNRRITGLYVYPVKSLQAVSLEVACIDTKGFAGDRRFMVVSPAPVPLWGSFGPKDATHRFLTQRQCPSLATVQAIQSNDGKQITLSRLSKRESVTFSTVPHAESKKMTASLWDENVLVQDMGDKVAHFLQTIVDEDEEVSEGLKKGGIRLVAQAVEDSRAANDRYVPAAARTLTGSSPPVGFTDGFPILIACVSSLRELNGRLEEKGKDSLPMSRFRPNIVITGTDPFEEDRWKVIRIGGKHLFHVVKGCPRCKQSCTDQQTGQVTEEPLETLREFRAMTGNKENLYFAQNALAGAGTAGQSISIGDSVEVLQWGKPVWDEEPVKES